MLTIQLAGVGCGARGDHMGLLQGEEEDGDEHLKLHMQWS